jgi:hypothetical protein
MSQITESKQEPIEWQPLDKVVREWAVMSQFENDQDWYNKLKEQCE